MATNNPVASPLNTYTERQLLVLMLVELRLHTKLISEEFDVKEDLDASRIEILSDNDIFSADGG